MERRTGADVTPLALEVAGPMTTRIAKNMAAVLVAGWLGLEICAGVRPAALTGAPPDVRTAASAPKRPITDLYGDWMPPRALARLGTIRLRHASMIRSIAFLPDGKSIASASNDRAIRVWDVATGKHLKAINRTQGFTENPHLTGFGYFASYTIDVSPDGALIASSGADFLVRLFDPKTAKEVGVLTGHENWIGPVRFARDGKRLISGSGDQSVRVWDVAAKKQLHKFVGADPDVHGVALSPDGKWAAAMGHNGTLQVWDLAMEKEKFRVKSHEGGGTAVVFAPDGQTVATSGFDKVIRFWDLKTGKEARKLERHVDAVNSIAFSPDGKTLASSGRGVVWLWDLVAGKVTYPALAIKGEVFTAVFSPDGKTIATAGSDQRIRLWDVATRKLLLTPQGHTGPLFTLAYSPDGKLIATGGLQDFTVRLWNAGTGQEVAQMSNHQGDVYAVAFAPDGRYIASSGADKLVYLWKMPANPQKQQTVGRGGDLGGYREVVEGLAFSPDSQLLATGAHDGTVRLWQLPSLKHMHTFGTGGKVTSVVFAPDGKTVAAGSVDRLIWLWDVKTGKVIRRFVGHEGSIAAGGLAFSPNGKYLASSSLDRSMRIWEVATGAERMCGRHPKGAAVNSLAFSPDGHYLALAETARLGHLLELASGKEALHLEGHDWLLYRVAFAPDGQSLATASSDSTVLTWDLVTPEARAAAAKGDLAALWTDLGSDNPSRAYVATNALTLAGGKTVDFLKGRLRSLPEPDAKQLRTLVAQLSSDKFPVRQAAANELTEFGSLAVPALRQALADKPALDTRRRVEGILKDIDSFVMFGEPLRTARAIRVLERVGTPQAHDLLAALAKGAPQARTTQEAKQALENLGRRLKTAR
jgi:WD40 repeat protein